MKTSTNKNYEEEKYDWKNRKTPNIDRQMVEFHKKLKKSKIKGKEE